jgi:putative exporter of polyketide antibiotics
MYAVPEKVWGISHNRSQVSFEAGYLLGAAFTIRALGSWGTSHGGWRQPIDWAGRTSIEMHSHDQLARTENFRLGGGISYSLTASMDVNVFGFGTVSGKNDVTTRGAGLSFTWSASPAQLIKKKRGPEPPQ